MKKIFFLTFLFAFSILKSQNSFEKTISKEYDQQPFAFEVYDNEMFLGINDFENEIIKYSRLVKLDNSGNILDSIEIDNVEGFIGKNLIQFSDTSFMLIGSIKSNSRYIMKAIEVGIDLNIIWQNEIFEFENEIIQIHSTVTENNSVFFGGFTLKGLIFNMFAFEMNFAREINFTDLNFLDTSGNLTSINYCPGKKRYFVFTNYAFDIPSAGQIAILDSNKNIIDKIGTPYNIHYQYTTKRINLENIIIGGMVRNIDNYDKNIALVNYNQLGFENSLFEIKLNETQDYPAFFKTFDFLFSNNIFLTGTVNFIVSETFTYFQETNNSFTICNLNEELELKWQKFYGGNAYYNMYYSKATDDGGFIVLGTVYDENKAENYRDIYLLKVDSLGNYIPAAIPGTLTKTDLNIYPNPGNDYFNLDLNAQQFPVELKIYDISGKLVLNETVESNSQTIYTSGLKSGLYLIRITDINKMVKTVKWVKE